MSTNVMHHLKTKGAPVHAKVPDPLGMSVPYRGLSSDPSSMGISVHCLRVNPPITNLPSELLPCHSY